MGACGNRGPLRKGMTEVSWMARLGACGKGNSNTGSSLPLVVLRAQARVRHALAVAKLLGPAPGRPPVAATSRRRQATRDIPQDSSPVRRPVPPLVGRSLLGPMVGVFARLADRSEGTSVDLSKRKTCEFLAAASPKCQ